MCVPHSASLRFYLGVSTLGPDREPSWSKILLVRSFSKHFFRGQGYTPGQGGGCRFFHGKRYLMGRRGIPLVMRQTAYYRGHLVQLRGSNNDECGKTSPAQTQMSSAPMPRSLSKAVPRVALVQLDGSTTETLTKAFAQCRIEAIPIGEDFPKRLGA